VVEHLAVAVVGHLVLEGRPAVADPVVEGGGGKGPFATGGSSESPIASGGVDCADEDDDERKRKPDCERPTTQVTSATGSAH